MLIYELLSPAAILISALGAWYFANKSITEARTTSEKKSAFDYLTQLSWDKDYIEAKRVFIEARFGPKKLRTISEEYWRLRANGEQKRSDADEETAKITFTQYSSITNILNEYEALAIAVKTGALHEEVIRENIHQQFIDHIDACKEFIDHTRKNSDLKKPERLWCEVRNLTEKWRKIL